MVTDKLIGGCFLCLLMMLTNCSGKSQVSQIRMKANQQGFDTVQMVHDTLVFSYHLPEDRILAKQQYTLKAKLLLIGIYDLLDSIKVFQFKPSCILGKYGFVQDTFAYTKDDISSARQGLENDPPLYKFCKYYVDSVPAKTATDFEQLYQALISGNNIYKSHGPSFFLDVICAKANECQLQSNGSRTTEPIFLEMAKAYDNYNLPKEDKKYLEYFRNYCH